MTAVGRPRLARLAGSPRLGLHWPRSAALASPGSPRLASTGRGRPPSPCPCRLAALRLARAGSPPPPFQCRLAAFRLSSAASASHFRLPLPPFQRRLRLPMLLLGYRLGVVAVRLALLFPLGMRKGKVEEKGACGQPVAGPPPWREGAATAPSVGGAGRARRRRRSEQRRRLENRQSVGEGRLRATGPCAMCACVLRCVPVCVLCSCACQEEREEEVGGPEREKENIQVGGCKMPRGVKGKKQRGLGFQLDGPSWAEMACLGFFYFFSLSYESESFQTWWYSIKTIYRTLPENN